MADVAAFDFDGTLTNGGSVFAFLEALTDRSTVLSASAALAPRLAHAAVVGGSVADRTKEQLFTRILTGVSAERLDDVAGRFATEHLAGHLRRDVHQRLEWHLRRGDHVVVVSASPECYVAPAADALGATGTVATRLEVDTDERLTGRYLGGNCRGEEKIRRLRLWIEEAGEDPTPGATRLWAYGNSRGTSGCSTPPTSESTWAGSGRWGACGSSPGSGPDGRCRPAPERHPVVTTRRPSTPTDFRRWPPRRSDVFLLPHPHHDEPPPDRRQVRREETLDEHRGDGDGLRDPGGLQSEDHPGLDHAHATRHR